MIMFKKFFLLSSLLFAAAVHADCKISTDEDSEGRKIIYAENSRIKVGIMPESNGRIAELILKEGEDERHFFPELIFQTLEVDDGISLVGKTNFAGLEDWAWESGAVKKNIPYTAKVVKNTPDEAVITLSAGFGSWARIERTMTIAKDSAVIKLDVKFTNNTDKEFKSSYWQHIMLGFDRDMDVRGSARLIIPLKNSGTEVFRNRLAVQRPGFDCLLDRPALTGNPAAEEVSRLIQPWRAVKHDDLLFGMIVPAGQLDKDFAAYHYADENALSVENVFAPVDYAPGQSNIFTSYITVSPALEKIDYIDDNVIAGCSIDGQQVTLTALRSGAKSDFIFSVKAVDASGKEVAGVKTAAVLPASGTPFTAELKFPCSVAGCRLFLHIAGKDGKEIAGTELLKQLKW